MGTDENKIVPDLILLVSGDGCFKEFEAGAVIDLLNDPNPGFHLNRILPADVVPGIMGIITAALDKGGVQLVRYTLELNGRREYFEAKAVPMNQSCTMLIIQNITQNEKNKRKLQQQKDLLQTVLDNITVEITAFDKEGNALLQNKASKAENDDIVRFHNITYNSNKFYKPDGKQKVAFEELPLARAMKGIPVYNEVIIKKEEGRPKKTYLVNAVPLLDANQQRNGVVLTQRDISDLKNMQFKLKSKVKDFDVFMYRASHDLKSPLAAMKGILDFSINKVSDPESLAFLKLIRKSQRHLSEIVNGLIELSRVSQKPLALKQTNLRSLVEEMIQSAQQLPGACGIEFNLQVPEGSMLYTDPELLKIILQKLLTNAVVYHKHAGANRFIKISACNQPDFMVIMIADNGQGIPESIHDKIFEMFFRGSTTASGSGLGLFVVMQALEKLSGHIELTSEERTGTSFLIEIPKTNYNEQT
jgi:signal transduction histidine kinase